MHQYGVLQNVQFWAHVPTLATFGLTLSFNSDMLSPASSWLVTFIINSPGSKTIVGIVVHGITVLIGQHL